MARRALLIGINRYPSDALRGCVNDVAAIAALITNERLFAASEWRVCVDERATAAENRARLDWLVKGAQSGGEMQPFFRKVWARTTPRNPRRRIQPGSQPTANPAHAVRLRRPSRSQNPLEKLSFPRFASDAQRAAHGLLVDKDAENARQATEVALALLTATAEDKAKRRWYWIRLPPAVLHSVSRCH